MPLVREQTPKHVQLTKILRKKIYSSFRPGERFQSEPQLMRKYNLSNTTVQKAIGTLVNAGLLHRVQGKGTFVAKPVLTSCDVLIQKEAFHEHSFYLDVIRGVESVAAGNGMNVTVKTYSLKNEGPTWDSIVNSVAAQPSSGKIIIPPADDRKLKMLPRDNTNFVIIGNYPLYPEMYMVGVDIFEGVFLLTEYLIKIGHKRIALVGGLLSKSRAGKDFLKGFRKAHSSYNIPMRQKWVMESEWSEEKGYELTKKVLLLKQKPTAIVCGDDTLAIGAIRALKDACVKIPDEIAVTGFNDLDLATIVTPSLTTMRIPRIEIGRKACDALLKLGRGEKIKEKHIVFKTELVERASTKK